MVVYVLGIIILVKLKHAIVYNYPEKVKASFSNLYIKPCLPKPTHHMLSLYNTK